MKNRPAFTNKFAFIWPYNARSVEVGSPNSPEVLFWELTRHRCLNPAPQVSGKSIQTVETDAALWTANALAQRADGPSR